MNKYNLGFISDEDIYNHVREDDVIANMNRESNQNTVFEDLKKIDSDIMKSLYLLAFKTYEGFENF